MFVFYISTLNVTEVVWKRSPITISEVTYHLIARTLAI
jgi:hypothetical protein